MDPEEEAVKSEKYCLTKGESGSIFLYTNTAFSSHGDM